MVVTSRGRQISFGRVGFSCKSKIQGYYGLDDWLNRSVQLWDQEMVRYTVLSKHAT